MGSLLGSSLALQYLDCVQDESALLRLNFWLGYALHEGKCVLEVVTVASSFRTICSKHRPWVELLTPDTTPLAYQSDDLGERN